MRLPKFGNFIPHNTQVHLHLYKNEKNEYGEFEPLYDGDVMCNFQSRSQKTFQDHVLISNNFTTILIFDDILPEYDILNSGYITYGGEKRAIVTGQRVRDIFGDFQYLQFDLQWAIELTLVLET